MLVLLSVEAILCVLLKEIVDSPLQYLFGYAIEIVIVYDQRTNGALIQASVEKEFSFIQKLLRCEMDLCIPLESVEMDSLTAVTEV